jgi:hypothetical protein
MTDACPIRSPANAKPLMASKTALRKTGVLRASFTSFSMLLWCYRVRCTPTLGRWRRRTGADGRMNRYADIRSCARSADCDAARAADHVSAEGPTTRAACGQNSAGEKIPYSWLASILNACLISIGYLMTDWTVGMSQNMPLLSRVLGTAALASVIVVLLMSYQWGSAAESPVTQVIRLHSK